ncbi:MAG: DUF748 domain-containing protein [Oceanospirillaceae bacterium]
MRYFISFFFVVALSVYSIPYLIKDQVLVWLKEQGVEGAKFKSANINWLEGSVELNELYASKPTGQKLDVLRVALKVDYASLFDRKILVHQLSLEGLDTSIIKNENEFEIGPLDIKKLLANSQSTEQQQTSASPESAWQFGIDEVVLQDINIQAWVPNFENQHLDLKKATLKQFYQWDNNQLSTLHLTAVLNKAPIELDIKAKPLASKKVATIKINATAFEVASLTKALLPELTTTADLALTFKLASDDNKIEFVQEGEFTLSALAWADTLQAKLQSVHWQGTTQVNLTENDLDSVSAKGSLKMRKLAVTPDKSTTLSLGGLDWQGPVLATFVKGKITELAVSDQFSLDQLKLTQPGQTISAKQLVSKPASSPIKLSLSDNQPTRLAFANTISATNLQVQLPQQQVKIQQLRLVQQQPAFISFKNSVARALSSKLNLNITGLSLKAANVDVSAKALTLQGPVSLDKLSATPVITSNTQFKATALSIALNKQFSVKSASLALQTKTEKMVVDQPRISNLNLQASQFSVTSLVNQLELVHLKKMKIENAAYARDSLQVKALTVNKLKLAKSQNNGTLSTVDTLSIDNVKLKNANQLTIDKVTLHNAGGALGINSEGELSLGVLLSTALATNKAIKHANVKKVNSGKAKPFQYMINNLSMTGNNIINIEDKSVDPWFKSTLDITHIQAKNINSASKQLIPVQMKAQINNETNIELDAKLSVFAPVINGSWQVKLDRLSLPVISPYAGKFSGYFLENGKLSLQSSGSIKSNKITGENKIKIEQLAVRSAQTAATAKTNSSLSMPVDVAISVLENDDGTINLAVPVSGSMDDPNFGYSSVVGIIAKKGLKKAAFGILTKALQPYGALITLASTAINAQESGTFINLAPITFAVGEQRISGKMQGYLKKIAKMMKNKKKLKLKICATAVLQDKVFISAGQHEDNQKLAKPLTAKLLNKSIANAVQVLATARGKNVEKALKKLKVNSDRLFVCFAKTNFKQKKLAPVVTLGL